MSSPIYDDHDEVDASDLPLIGIEGAADETEILLSLDDVDLVGEAFLNSSCALSPSETLSPNHDYDSIEDPLGLMEGILQEDSQALHLNNGRSASSPVDQVKKRKVGGGKNLKEAARQIIRVYPTQVRKSPAKRGKIMEESDEKCLNRNAINARENRERKKKYVNDLENTVERLTSENKLLTEKMSCTDSRIAKLEKELKYARSILANQGPLATIIGGLLKSTPELKIRPPLLLGSFSTPSDVVITEEESVDEKQAEPEKLPSEEYPEPEEPAKRYPKRKRNPKAKDFPPMKFTKTAQANSTSSYEMDHSYNKKNTAAGGICLHISQDDVSLQMCADCSKSAQHSLADGH